MKKLKFLINKAIYARREKDYKLALKSHNEAININPDFSKSYYDRGNTKVIMGDYAGAVIDFNISIKLNPNNAAVYINRGIIKERLGDAKGSEKDFKLAKALGDLRAFSVRRDLIF